MLRTVLLGSGVVAALFSVLIFSGKLSIGNKDQQALGNVVMWGTIPETTMNRFIQEFNPKAKDYSITYQEVSEAGFSQTLLEALANNTAPDLIIAPHQIILANAARIYPFPQASFPEETYRKTYVSGASLFLVPQGILALPVSIDPLVLFYNRTLFAKHGIVSPPAAWGDITRITPLLTVTDARGNFIESAIALGAPKTPYLKDIVMAVVGQLGQTPVLKQYLSNGATTFSVTANRPAVEGGDVFPVATTVHFMSQFADPRNPNYTWSPYASNATDQFVAEKVAMYIGYASELATLRARNPKADFDMTNLPQTQGYNTFVTGGQMYGIATLTESQNLVTALTVQSQFASEGISPAIAGSVGAVPALLSYANSPNLSPVIRQSMLVARPWYDSFPVQSTALIEAMFSDILSGRVTAANAATSFVSRLQDLYTPN